MLKYENDCVDCGKYCLYEICPYYNVAHYYCDECDEPANYQIDGQDLCESCAEDYFKQCFEVLTAEEKAEILETEFSIIR